MTVCIGRVFQGIINHNVAGVILDFFIPGSLKAQTVGIVCVYVCHVLFRPHAAFAPDGLIQTRLNAGKEDRVHTNIGVRCRKSLGGGIKHLEFHVRERECPVYAVSCLGRAISSGIGKAVSGTAAYRLPVSALEGKHIVDRLIGDIRVSYLCPELEIESRIIDPVKSVYIYPGYKRLHLEDDQLPSCTFVVVDDDGFSVQRCPRAARRPGHYDRAREIDEVSLGQQIVEDAVFHQ